MKPDLFKAPDYYNLDDLLTEEHKLVRDAAREWVKRDVSPIIEEAAQKAEFPKSIIVTAGFDPLCDEAEKYAYLLHQKHINIHQLHYPSLIHGFASMSKLKKAKLAVDNFLDEYKKIL